MLAKIWAIARRDLYLMYSDRNLVLIMIVTPIALATIIGLAFGNLFSGGAGISDLPVALVNQDRPIELGGESTTFGEVFDQALIPPDGTTAEQRDDNILWQLLATERVADVATARSGVDSGTYIAAIIVPQDFSAKIATLHGAGEVQQTSVEVYSSPASQIGSNVVRSVVDTIVSQIVSGNVAIGATIDALIKRAETDPVFGRQFGAAAENGSFQPDWSSVFDLPQTITINQQSGSGVQAEFNPFVIFGTGQAVFFMMFLAMGGASSVLYERRDGTLQRMLASPTPRAVILLGKACGTLITCIIQVSFLLIALTLISSILRGEFQFIFGPNIVGVVATIIAVALAATGLGTIVMALVRSPNQGDVIGSVISMVMGLFGGAFFNIAALGPLSLISRFTINFWGVDAFTRLSQRDNDILLNLAVLLTIGVVTFVTGFFLFERRLED